MDAGGIPIVHNRDVLREPFDEAYLSLGQGCSAGSHHVGDSKLVHREHIQIAFNQIAFVLPGHLVLGEPDSVKGLVLDVDVRLLGVHVLGVRFSGFLRLQGPGPERYDPSAHRMDREHDTVEKPVVQSVVRIIGGAQSRLKEIFILVAGGLGCVGKGVTARWSPSKAIFLDGSVLQSPGMEIFKYFVL